MAQQQFFVVPITHVDLAWKRGRAEMSEMLEIVVIRLLDALENDPDFKEDKQDSRSPCGWGGMLMRLAEPI